jgi:hypothetical protein
VLIGLDLLYEELSEEDLVGEDSDDPEAEDEVTAPQSS